MNSFTSLLLLTITLFANGHTFNCLDACQCSSQEQLIRCESSNRTVLATPPENEQLAGFSTISLNSSKILNLPDEKTLLQKFPDLREIQIFKNMPFNCSSLPNYQKIKISHDCVIISDVDVFVPEHWQQELLREMSRKDKGAVIKLLEVFGEDLKNVNWDDVKRVLEVFHIIAKLLAPLLQTAGFLFQLVRS